MATMKQKVQELIDMLGEKAKPVVEAALEAQKQADASGVEFKEVDDTPSTDEDETAQAEEEVAIEKARRGKKRPAPPPVKDEDEDEEDDEEEDEVDEEEEKDIDDEIDFTDDDEAGGDFDAWEEDEESDPDFMALGDVDVKDYGELMAEVMTEAVRPISEDIASLKEAIGEIRQFLGRTKEHQEEGVVLALEAAKEHETRLKSVEDEAAKLRKALKEALTMLKDLQSDLPSGIAGGFIASQAKETELSEDEQALKEGPQQDPLAGFMNFVMQTK